MDGLTASDRALLALPVASGPLRPNAISTWTQIGTRAPQLASTMTKYLDQIAISSRPGTVESAGLSLRVFAEHLIETDPGCRCVADVTRTHIESFKLALAKRPGKDSSRPATATIRHRLGMLRTFFERIIEWDYADAPRKVPIFAGDFPKADEPLPRFLDDPTAAKLMAGLAKEPILRKRLVVELLARTGMRSGEVGALRDDGVFRLSGAFWLKIPVGKLHNDRTIPLHPVLVDLITEYRAERGANPSGHLMARVDGQPIDRRTIHRYVETIARRAGVGHVHPHQLRHTLATQLINRGMSLEAIAALLGHRSPRMTLVYARISNDNVAEQYFRATQAVEQFAGAPTSEAGAQPITRSRRLLGNGHCTRPAQLDCSFQTICEGCGFFETGPEFIPILRRQKENSAELADFERAQIYQELIDGLTTDKPLGRPHSPAPPVHGL
jgi:site-specific recombinase XerD